MTFDEIRTKTVRAAQNLQARGYNQKQTFGMITANSDFVAPIFFASIANGWSIHSKININRMKINVCVHSRLLHQPARSIIRENRNRPYAEHNETGAHVL